MKKLFLAVITLVLPLQCYAEDSSSYIDYRYVKPNATLYDILNSSATPDESFILNNTLFRLDFVYNKKKTEKLSFSDVNPFTSIVASAKMLNVTIAVFLVSALLTFFASTGFDQNFNYFLRAKFNFAPSSSGMFKAVVGTISLTMNMTINMWIVKKFNISKAMCVTVMLAGASLIGVVMAPNQTVVMAFALMYYAFYAIYTPLQQAVMLKNDDDSSKGAVAGLFNTSRSIGMMAGPTFAGLIFDIDPNYAFIAFAVALMLGAAVGWKNYLQLKEKGVYKD